VVIVTSGGALVASLLFLLLAFEGSQSVGAYLGVLFIFSVADIFNTPAMRALFPSLVRGANYMRANALTQSVSEVAAIAGPAFAGLLIAFHGWFAFAVTALLQLVTLVALFFLPRGQPAAQSEESLLASVRSGFRFIIDKKTILGAISLDLFAVLFGGATSLLPIYATQILHVGATGYGLLRAAPSVGAAFVATWMLRHPIQRNGGRWMFWCVAGFGVATIVFGLSRNLALSVVALAATGGFDMVSVVIRNALTQLGVPEMMRGRIGAVENIFIGASNQLGMFESGLVASWFGPVTSVVFGGAATIAIVVLWVGLFPALRRLDHLDVSPRA
jgi:Transmembrane secretion effector